MHREMKGMGRANQFSRVNKRENSKQGAPKTYENWFKLRYFGKKALFATFSELI